MTAGRQEYWELLKKHADRADQEPRWPDASWAALARLGGLRWCIPENYGGDGRTAKEVLHEYERLASACLTTCFLLSQRDAAIRRLLDSDNDELARSLLPDLARGKSFITVGLAQLTTSRQHTGPALTARETSDGFVIDGVIPWVTGAAHADDLVIGAVTESGKQILAVLPSTAPGVTIDPPLDLMALAGSLTAAVRCQEVPLPRRSLLAGPADQVLRGRRGGAGGLETSCLAVGLAGAALEHLLEEARHRPELAKDASHREKALQMLREEMYRLADGGVSTEAAQHLRARANALVLRITAAALAASKGTGFVRPHPAQRWAHQALFFLVWSCPGPVAAETLAYLTPPD